jgi:hypothetical protein
MPTPTPGSSWSASSSANGGPAGRVGSPWVLRCPTCRPPPLTSTLRSTCARRWPSCRRGSGRRWCRGSTAISTSISRRAAPAPADRGHGGPHPGGSATDRPPTRLAGAQKRSPDASTICRPLAHQAGADQLMGSCAVMRCGIGSRQRAGCSCGAPISMQASPAKAPTPGKSATQPIPRRAAGVSGRPSPPLYD